MLIKTNYSVPQSLLSSIPFDSFQTMKTAINRPTGNFFYDPWEIKDEFRDTVFEQLLNTLPKDIGEARVIVLESESCYTKHADIDDRYHLNLHGDEGYLIDLESNTMYHTVNDGNWYLMNAGILHTAASFGEHKRIQLVVRKLLIKNQLADSVAVSITATGENPRYKFDNVLSPWLNRANKNNLISNFQYQDSTVKFNIEKTHLSDLKNKCLDNFTLIEF
jgi:hypothetical protein